jgi:hypothetical protein
MATVRASERVPAVAAGGNLAVEALLRGGLIRAKLEVGVVDDPEEHEADAVADRIMCSADEACCSSYGSGGDCEAETARRKPADGSAMVSRGVEGRVRELFGRGENLSPSLRSFLRTTAGPRPVGRAREHRDGAAAESAKGLGARAYTLGSDIAFAAGQWQPDPDSGRHLIAHELAHVSAPLIGTDQTVVVRSVRGGWSPGA